MGPDPHGYDIKLNTFKMTEFNVVTKRIRYHVNGVLYKPKTKDLCTFKYFSASDLPFLLAISLKFSDLPNHVHFLLPMSLVILCKKKFMMSCTAIIFLVYMF